MASGGCRRPDPEAFAFPGKLLRSVVVGGGCVDVPKTKRDGLPLFVSGRLGNLCSGVCRCKRQRPLVGSGRRPYGARRFIFEFKNDVDRSGMGVARSMDEGWGVRAMALGALLGSFLGVEQCLTRTRVGA